MIKRIRATRIARSSFCNDSHSEIIDNNRSGKYSASCEKIKRDDRKEDQEDLLGIKDIKDVDKLLAELKKDEPTSDNKLFRLSIIAYEIGDIHRSIVYAERFKNDEKMKIAHLANGKLALADALTQLYLLCLSIGWDFHELRKLGADHLKERHGDFKRNGWRDIK